MSRPDPDVVASLEEERDFLLRSLADLDREAAAGDLDPEDHATLRADYTARAADVLRQLDRARDDLTVATTTAAADVSRTRRVLTVAAVGLALVGIGWGVAAASGERGVGDVATGSIRQTSSDRLARARLAMGTGDVGAAVGLFDEVLVEDPTNREALAYKGWLLVLAGGVDPDSGLVDDGAELLDAAVEADPDYADARFFRAFLRYRHAGDLEGALDDARAFMALDPPPAMVPEVAALIDELVEALGGGSTPQAAEESTDGGGE